MAKLYKRKDSKYFQIRDGSFRKTIKTSDLATAKKLLLEYEYEKTAGSSNILQTKKEINEIFERYFKKRNKNGKSEKSVKFDKARAEQFLKFCKLKKIRFIEDVNDSILQKYFDMLAEPYPSPRNSKIMLTRKDSTLRRHENTLLAIFNSAKLKNNPFNDIDLTKPGKKLFRFLKLKEIKKLIKTAKKNMPGLLGVVALGYYAGLKC